MSTISDLVSTYRISFPKGIDQEKVVVIIEDQTDMRLIIAHHLNKLGFKNTKQFSSGMEALEWLEKKQSQISITICDHEMPIMNGFDFLQEIKSDTKLTRGPFAITIEQPNREKIMLATENGVDGVLVKPFTLKDILPKLRQAFKTYHNPNNPELLYEAAKKCFNTGNIDLAKKIFTSLSEVTEKAARPLVGLALIAIKEEKLDEAERLFKDAQSRNEHYVHTYVERGQFFASQDRIDEAVAQFKKAIELSPLNPVRYEKAAELLFKLKRHQEAVDLLNIAITNDMVFPSIHHHLSQGYYVLKDFKKAIRHIRSALSHEPENVTYLNQLGIAYKESEQFEEAMQTYNSIIKFDPENKPALFNKAVLLKSKGSLPEAIKLLEKIVTKFPDFTQAEEKLNNFKQEQKGLQEAG